MTAATASYHQRSFPTALFLLSIVIALAAVSMHALTKHGTAAIVASQCADHPEFRMVNPTNQRIANICLTERGWGIAIIESNGDPVTAFVKDKARRLEQVIRYLENSGYRR